MDQYDEEVPGMDLKTNETNGSAYCGFQHGWNVPFCVLGFSGDQDTCL